METLEHPIKVGLWKGLNKIVSEEADKQGKKVSHYCRDIIAQHHNYQPGSNGKGGN